MQTRVTLARIYQLILDLLIDAARGRPVRVPDDDRAAVEEYLTVAVVEAHHGRHGLIRHVQALRRLRVPFATPPGRRPGAPAAVLAADGVGPLLAEAQVVALGQRGMAALADPAVFPDANATLAELLTNPAALWDLADYVWYTLPAGWIDRLEVCGRKLAEEAGLDLNDEGKEGARERHSVAHRLEGARKLELVVDQPGLVRVEFLGPDGAAAACELARRAYGDPAQEFTLALLPVPERGVVVEFLPAPTAATVTHRVVFGPGAERTVEIPVPAPDTPVWKRGQSAAIPDVIDAGRELVGVVASVEGGAVVLTCETRPKK